VLQQLSPKTWLRKVKRVRRDWQLFAEAIPRGVGGIMELLQTGKFSIHVKHPALDTTVSRLVFGLCTSAFLLASALLWVHDVPPSIHGVSIIGAAGYMMAALLIIRVMWNISWNKPKDE
jgi:ubiquinone biosynthesis protein